MRFDLLEIRHDQTSFEKLAELHATTQTCFANEIEINMERTHWFDADMCAAFGAILYALGVNLNMVNLIGLTPEVERILSKNGFLSHYGRVKLPDNWGTTISYQRFEVKDDRFFAGYIEEELISHSELPNMSPGLSKKFRESIFEIFSNAVLHSKTKRGIFSCGQFFPRRKTLDFTVADLGVGIRKNVQNHFGRDFSPEDAIAWATEGSNTTKQGAVPGGLGLKLLCEFIDLNGGCIQIVSDSGYWKRKQRKTVKTTLQYPFPGTAVSVEINTADDKSYTLTSELSSEDIF